jgi:hypothetical protein
MRVSLDLSQFCKDWVLLVREQKLHLINALTFVVEAESLDGWHRW